MESEIQKKEFKKASKRCGNALSELPLSEYERRRPAFLGPMTTSSPRMLEAIVDIELENVIKLNPNTTDQQKKESLQILENIRASERRNKQK